MELDDLARGDAANGSRARARSLISSLAAASAWPETWPIFPSSAGRNTADRSEIEAHPARPHHATRESHAICVYVDVNKLESIDRQFLVERQLISRELAESEGGSVAWRSTPEQVSLMINEEDHFRIQVMQSGLDLQTARQPIDRIDDLWPKHQVTYAFQRPA